MISLYNIKRYFRTWNWYKSTSIYHTNDDWKTKINWCFSNLNNKNFEVIFSHSKNSDGSSKIIIFKFRHYQDYLWYLLNFGD